MVSAPGRSCLHLASLLVLPPSSRSQDQQKWFRHGIHHFPHQEYQGRKPQWLWVPEVSPYSSLLNVHSVCIYVWDRIYNVCAHMQIKSWAQFMSLSFSPVPLPVIVNQIKGWWAQASGGTGGDSLSHWHAGQRHPVLPADTDQGDKQKTHSRLAARSTFLTSSGFSLFLLLWGIDKEDYRCHCKESRNNDSGGLRTWATCIHSL